MSDTYTLSERVAEEIRAALARRRMSGRQLAAALGVSQTWMSTRLNGVTPIDLNDLERIAGVINVEVSDLLPPSRDGRTVVVAGDARRQTTVPSSELAKRLRLNGLPGNPIPKLSTRRPALLVPAYA
jgi:transcriptional regulator with XRE-family HTH domain